MGSSELISEISTVTTSLCDPYNNLQRWLNSLLKIWNAQDSLLTSMTLRAKPGWTCLYLGDCLRGLNLNPTLKMIEKLGGTKKKGEKFLKLEEFYPVYKEVKNSKDTGSFEDFIECLKLYDKLENGTMMLGELEHILLSLGEKLEREEVDILIKECCDPE